MPTSSRPKTKSLLDRLPFIGGDEDDLELADLLRPAKSVWSKVGDQIEPILYQILCDPKNALRRTVDNALQDGTKSAVLVLAPLLIAQFALAPAVAGVVAAIVVKALATRGQKKLCDELRAEAGKSRGAKRPAAKMPAKSKTAKRTPQSSGRARPKPASKRK